MKFIFSVPEQEIETINLIKQYCTEECSIKRKNGFNGETLTLFITVATPIIWELANKLLENLRVTVQIELEDGTTTTISDWSIERAHKKADAYKKRWEESR